MMNRLLALVTFILFFCSCQKKEVIITSIPNDKNVLSVHVTFCSTIHCNTTNNVQDVKISLYESREHAIAETQAIVEAYTNNEGIAQIVVVDRSNVFIRADYPDKGIYTNLICKRRIECFDIVVVSHD